VKRLTYYTTPHAYLRQEHGAETREEASRVLGRLLGEQDRIRLQVEDLVKAINAAWPLPREEARAMNLKVTPTATLMTDSPASSYGQPVLRVEGRDLGPADLMPAGEFAADVVRAWALGAGRSAEEREAARRFLRQWPEGPQLSRE